MDIFGKIWIRFDSWTLLNTGPKKHARDDLNTGSNKHARDDLNTGPNKHARDDLNTGPKNSLVVRS